MTDESDNLPLEKKYVFASAAIVVVTFTMGVGVSLLATGVNSNASAPIFGQETENLKAIAAISTQQKRGKASNDVLDNFGPPFQF